MSGEELSLQPAVNPAMLLLSLMWKVRCLWEEIPIPSLPLISAHSEVQELICFAQQKTFSKETS